MATTRKDSAGIWWLRYRDPDGTQRTRKLTGVSKPSEAKAKLLTVAWRIGQGLFGDPADEPTQEKAPTPLVTTSIDGWSYGIKNRNRVSDGQQARKWLVTSPALTVPMGEFSLKTVKAYVDELHTTTLGGGSQRRMLTLLGRWAAWAVGEELIPTNHVKSLPRDRKPVYDRGDPTTKPWVQTDNELAKLMASLPEGLRLPLLLGNRSGLRLGETFGLRLSDLEDVDKGYVRVAKSFGGPLKESKPGLPKVKHPPIQPDVAAKLMELAVARRLAGAGPEDLLFVPSAPGARQRPWRGYLPHTVNAAWRQVRKATGFTGTWKDATRHSFSTRNIIAGVSVHAVSHALGHASVITTERNYAHVIRVVYPDGLLK